MAVNPEPSSRRNKTKHVYAFIGTQQPIEKQAGFGISETGLLFDYITCLIDCNCLIRGV